MTATTMGAAAPSATGRPCSRRAAAMTTAMPLACISGSTGYGSGMRSPIASVGSAINSQNVKPDDLD